MTDTIVAFLLGIIAALLIYPSGNRLDAAFPDSGWSKKVSIGPRIRPLLFFKKADQRNKHMVLGLVFAVLGYFVILVSVVFFALALVGGRADQMFYSGIASFACMALAAIAYIIEMLAFLIAEIKLDKHKGEEE